MTDSGTTCLDKIFSLSANSWLRDLCSHGWKLLRLAGTRKPTPPPLPLPSHCIILQGPLETRDVWPQKWHKNKNFRSPKEEPGYLSVYSYYARGSEIEESWFDSILGRGQWYFFPPQCSSGLCPTRVPIQWVPRTISRGSKAAGSWNWPFTFI